MLPVRRGSAPQTADSGRALGLCSSCLCAALAHRRVKRLQLPRGGGGCIREVLPSKADWMSPRGLLSGRRSDEIAVVQV